jgi:LPS sulfotransferase NodH
MKDLKTQFVVLTTQRTGSSMLMDLINAHPEIQSYGEVFLDRPRTEEAWNKTAWPTWRFYEYNLAHRTMRPFITFQYLDQLAAEGFSKAPVTGYKLMYGHLARKKEILWYWRSRKCKVIHLIRENHFDNLLSQHFNKQFRIQHVVEGQKQQVSQQIHLDTHQLLDKLQRLAKRKAYHQKLLKFLGYDHLEITYDGLIHRKAETLQHIESFLGIAHYQGYETKFKKVDSRSYADKIANYEEVRSVLAGTPFAIG